MDTRTPIAHALPLNGSGPALRPSRAPDRARPPRRVARVSAVIPTLNEAENLPRVLPSLPEMVEEVLLVDGHSTDDTSPSGGRCGPT